MCIQQKWRMPSRTSKVRQVTVIGIPHDDWGEAVLALIIPADDSVTEGEILTFSRETISDLQAPETGTIRSRVPIDPLC